MLRLNSSFVLGYHGCDADVAEKLLKKEKFRPSQNLYDWLGHGIYFWEANPQRAMLFAREAMRRPSTRIGSTSRSRSSVIMTHPPGGLHRIGTLR